MSEEKKQHHIVGITGGIATGKSTVSESIVKLGFPVICADEIVKELYQKGQPIYHKVVKHFGQDFLDEELNLNREKLAALIFHNDEEKAYLEKLVHPEVRKAMEKRAKEFSAQGHELIFLDIPLLFESDLEHSVEKIICVAADQKIQIERLKKNRNMSTKQALERIHAQIPLHEKMKKSDYVIYNNRGQSELNKKTRETVQKLQQLLLNP